MTSPVAFEYVGPAGIRDAAKNSSSGRKFASRAELEAWVRKCGGDGWFTYVVDLSGSLKLAPRRSEHVACAGGEPVLAAGELRFGAMPDVVEVTNNSTGYCPAESCWSAVDGALARLGLRGPEYFTFTAIFRRCPACGERILVKDGWFFCDLCDAELPREWNFQ